MANYAAGGGPHSESKMMDEHYQLPLPLSAPDDLSNHKQLMGFESTPQSIRQ